MGRSKTFKAAWALYASKKGYLAYCWKGHKRTL